MKIIAISMRVTEAKTYYELRNSISFDIINYIQKMGFLPLLIPNNLINPVNFLKNFNVKGVLFAGGNNVNPKLYGSNEELDDVYDVRDKTEVEILNYALKLKLPIVGLCRGFHFLNVFFGGKIYNNIKGHVNTKHVLISKNSNFDSLIINSFHNHGVRDKDIALSLTSIAKSEDGIIEAFENKKLKLLALQWHPERDSNGKEFDIIKNHFYTL